MITVFVDRCIPIAAVRALQLANPPVRVIHHDDRYGSQSRVADAQWLLDAAQRGEVCVTRDKKLTKKRGIQAYVAPAGAVCFVFNRSDSPSVFGWLRELVNTIDDIAQFAAGKQGPLVVAIDRNRRFRKVYP